MTADSLDQSLAFSPVQAGFSREILDVGVSAEEEEGEKWSSEAFLNDMAPTGFSSLDSSPGEERNLSTDSGQEDSGDVSRQCFEETAFQTPTKHLCSCSAEVQRKPLASCKEAFQPSRQLPRTVGPKILLKAPRNHSDIRRMFQTPAKRLSSNLPTEEDESEKREKDVFQARHQLVRTAAKK
jgi:hypothetical protein